MAAGGGSRIEFRDNGTEVLLWASVAYSVPSKGELCLWTMNSIAKLYEVKRVKYVYIAGVVIGEEPSSNCVAEAIVYVEEK